MNSTRVPRQTYHGSTLPFQSTVRTCWNVFFFSQRLLTHMLLCCSLGGTQRKKFYSMAWIDAMKPDLLRVFCMLMPASNPCRLVCQGDLKSFKEFSCVESRVDHYFLQPITRFCEPESSRHSLACVSCVLCVCVCHASFYAHIFDLESALTSSLKGSCSLSKQDSEDSFKTPECFDTSQCVTKEWSCEHTRYLKCSASYCNNDSPCCTPNTQGLSAGYMASSICDGRDDSHDHAELAHS